MPQACDCEGQCSGGCTAGVGLCEPAAGCDPGTAELCAPSRASLFTSRTPDSLGVYHCCHCWSDTSGRRPTLFKIFRNAGYRTAAYGKVYGPDPGCAGKMRDSASYTVTVEALQEVASSEVFAHLTHARLVNHKQSRRICLT